MTHRPLSSPAPTPPGAIVVCQMEVIPGNPEVNLARILRGIDEAWSAGAALVLFPEMALCVAIPAAIVAHYLEGRILAGFRRVDDVVAGLLPAMESLEGRGGRGAAAQDRDQGPARGAP